jgi:[acyl-carrier-protein] S-malonyltransferase
MSKRAFLSPGQGAQYVGMGKDLHDSFDLAKRYFQRADEILGFSLTGLMFGSGSADEDILAAEADALRQTEVSQPALYVHSAICSGLLAEKGLKPDVAAGHSVGEYGALFAAQAISFDDGLRIIRKRGELMGAAGKKRPGTMCAIIGLSNEEVQQACASVNTDMNIVQAANFNAPGQVVISGDVSAVEQAAAAAADAGASKTIMLTVSGAFHSPLVEEARIGLAEELLQLQVNVPACPVYLNVTAAASQDPEEIRQRLIDQITAPVRWAQSLEVMQADGVENYLETGPGRVLSGLVKRTLGRRVPTAQAGTAIEINAITE